MSRATSLLTAIDTGTLTTEHQSLTDLRLADTLVAQGAIYKSFPTFHVVPCGGGWILLHQRSHGFRGAAANLSQCMLILLKATSSPWTWICLQRKNQWKWIHLHPGKASNMTSCLPTEVATSIGSAPGALDFHLGVEESPSAREPLGSCCTPEPLLPHLHRSPRPLTSSSPSSEQKGRT